MSLTQWLSDANSLGKGKSRSELIDVLGQPPGKITSNGRGGWKKRTGNRSRQANRRSSFDQTSTPKAAAEAKKISDSTKQINGQASMIGLEPMQIEHLADQSDSKYIESGAAGDPTNKMTIRQSDARFKDRVKQIVGDDFGVTLNPPQNSVKAVPIEFFDPLADPSTLPGIDIEPGSDLNNLKSQLEGFGKSNNNGTKTVTASFQYDKPNLTALRAAAKTAAFTGAVLPAALGSTASAAEVITRHRIAQHTDNDVDKFQSRIAQFSAAMDAVSYIPTPHTVIGGAVLSTGADLANGTIDVVRDSMGILKRLGLRL